MPDIGETPRRRRQLEVPNAEDGRPGPRLGLPPSISPRVPLAVPSEGACQSWASLPAWSVSHDTVLGWRRSHRATPAAVGRNPCMSG
jgi:hypothetical protein